MFLLDLLFPKICVGCGFLGSYICMDCRKKLIYITKDPCPYCQRPSLYGLTHPVCRRKNGLDGSLSLFLYNDFLKKIVAQLKYRGVTEILRELYQNLKPHSLKKLTFFTRVLDSSVFLTPIPLFGKKQRERGFNQARLITHSFSAILRIDIKESLTRIKDTRPQAKIARSSDRIGNMRSAFSINGPEFVALHTYILVDDVTTSGATLTEAARTLKIAGASRVFGLTLAKGYTKKRY